MTKAFFASICTTAIALVFFGTSHAVVSNQPPLLPKTESGLTREAGRPGDAHRWREGVLLVRFKPGVSKATTGQLHALLGSERIREFPEWQLDIVKLKDGLSVDAAVKLYGADPRVLYAEPDFRVSVQATPNDPRFSEMWSLNNTGQTGGTSDADIDAPEAWNVATGSNSVVVAVIDTGIDNTHPDLVSNLWVNPGEIPGNGVDDDGDGYVDDVNGINAITHTGNPWDDHGHGTHVAGTIGAAGNNGTGVVGINWNVRVLSCKFLDQYGNGYTSDAVTCLLYVKLLKDRGVAIVATSNSWGGSDYSSALSDAINAQREVLFVAAAGNDSRTIDYSGFYPASYDLPNVISVAATNATDTLAGFSNFGGGTVQIAAPGDSILSTLPATNYWGIPGGYGSLSGTSMATPHVSGVAALLKGAAPGRDWRAIRNLVLSGGDAIASVDGKSISGRRLNAFGSVSCSNRPLLRAVHPPITATVGVPVTLRVLSITCEASTGPVTVTTSQGETVNLLDNGVAPDAAAADGVFTGTWTPLRNPEKLSVSSPAGSLTLRVPPPYIGHYLADGSTRAPYSQRLAATGTVAPITWSVVSGSLPPGLGLNATTGEISGQPTAVGTFAFAVQLGDAWGPNPTRGMSIRVGDRNVAEDFARTLHEGEGADSRAVAVDASGNVYVVGNLGALVRWTGSGWAGNGNNYLAKYNSSGALVWLQRYNTGFLRSIAVDGSGAIFAAGGTEVWDSGDTLLAKFDASGAVLWTRTYNDGSGTDVAMAVKVSTNGDIFLGGVCQSAGLNRMCIQKLDASGNSVWLRTYSNGGADYGYAVGADGLGNSYLGGSSATLVPNQFGGYDYYYDFVVRKYDSFGNLMWSRSHDTGSRYDFLSDLDVAGSGDVYALGNPDEGGFNGYVTFKYSGAGSLLWARTYQSTSHQPTALAIDADENVYSTGGSWMEAGTGDWDFLTLKYDRWGNLVWKNDTDARYYTSMYDGDKATGVAVDASGHVYVTGASNNGVDGLDMLLIRYSAFSGPGEASPDQQMTAARGSGPNKIDVNYHTGCGATDHVIVWGRGPIGGGPAWSDISCGRGNSGSTNFDPGAVVPGSLLYFVVVAQDAWNEGSYGQDSARLARSELSGLGNCDKPVYLEKCSSP